MAERTVTVELSQSEWQLISALRDVPPSPARTLLEEVVRHLVEMVREPSCAEMQADGVPCDRVDADCEECRQLERLLATLRARGPFAQG